ncbi:unnamed protein product [Cylicocyclus nassatus]|uniref:Uncharacterized protein n=1 Tax=Cylicocyclus nassatus TaxID=53992 RepID=A0AA36DQ95_CYLNA|nr:unnamed protein product [Cylicocyclus nassatus]
MNYGCTTYTHISMGAGIYLARVLLQELTLRLTPSIDSTRQGGQHLGQFLSRCLLCGIHPKEYESAATSQLGMGSERSDVLSSASTGCSHDAQYLLKTEGPNAKVNVKKMMDKCKKDSKVPKIVCEVMKKEMKKDKFMLMLVEWGYTWKQLCDLCK